MILLEQMKGYRSTKATMECKHGVNGPKIAKDVLSVFTKL